MIAGASRSCPMCSKSKTNSNHHSMDGYVFRVGMGLVTECTLVEATPHWSQRTVRGMRRLQPIAPDLLDAGLNMRQLPK